MQYSLVKSCLLALTAVSSVVAQTAGFNVFTAPITPGDTIPAGSPYKIEWTPSAPAGKISIVLLQGSSNITLQIGPTIVSGIDSVAGSYEWTVPATGTDFATYGLKIQLDSDTSIFQYSTYFSISGLSSSGASGSSTAAGATVTVKVSSVPATTTTISASLVTISNSTTTSAASSGLFPNSSIITTTATRTTAVPTGAGSATGSAAKSSSSSGAMAGIAITGTGLLGALMVSLGMLL